MSACGPLRPLTVVLVRAKPRISPRGLEHAPGPPGQFESRRQVYESFGGLPQRPVDADRPDT